MKLPLQLCPNAPIVAGMPNGGMAQIIGIKGMPNLSEQDAAFIVRACNTHAALVAFAERVAGWHGIPKQADARQVFGDEARSLLASLNA